MLVETEANSVEFLPKVWGRIRTLFGGREEKEREEPEKEPEPAHGKHAEGVLSEKMGIPKDHEKYPQLRDYLVAFLSGESGVEALYRWSELLSRVIGKQVDRKLADREREWKAEVKENSKVSLDQAMSKAVKTGLLTLSDETAIQMLELLDRNVRSLSELKNALGLISEARWRLEWLESLGLVKPVLGKGENAIYGPTDRGEEMLEKIRESSKSRASVESQRHRLAEMAAGKNTTADELLNVLDGSWLENHRSKLEKIRKKYKDPLVGISRSFWLEREGGDPHLKHAGIDIADHEASGTLLCLELMNVHAKEREEKEPQNAWRSLFGKKAAAT